MIIQCPADRFGKTYKPIKIAVCSTRLISSLQGIKVKIFIYFYCLDAFYFLKNTLVFLNILTSTFSWLKTLNPADHLHAILKTKNQYFSAQPQSDF